MLRALAGYFFGGPQDEIPQEHVECETKEVNDWLVVNMPDQREEDIDFDEDADNGDEMEVEDMDEMEFEDLDEILQCLSNWFTVEEQENEPPISHDKRIVVQPLLPHRIELLFTEDRDTSEEFNLNLKGCIDTLVPQPLWPGWWHMIPTLRPRTHLGGFNYKRGKDSSNANVTFNAYDIKRARDLFQQTLKEKNGKRVVKTSEVTCHPVYSKTYVNHRHPALSPPKTDLMQKIKELEPEQRANQHAMKKHISSKGQIKRQNKNFIYETSTKKNRRKNLQRNPSGANNNRKCCY